MKEALYYKKLKNKIVQCQLCPHFCVLKQDEVGKCRVRQNISGTLYSLVFGKACSIAIDPIEKKPLYRFLPGTKTLSIATVGCNLSCLQCQNYEISQVGPTITLPTTQPKKIIETALKEKCPSISYTYSEPTIAYEYVLSIAKLAKKNNIKNIIVSNGFINPEPLKKLCKYLNAANIDIKSFRESFYKKVCKSSLKPVLEALKILKENNIHIEITNLLIPTLNDNPKEIEEMCKWIKENLGEKTPLHFSRFFPMYQLKDVPITPIETLEKAKQIGDKYLKYVYIGNV